MLYVNTQKHSQFGIMLTLTYGIRSFTPALDPSEPSVITPPLPPQAAFNGVLLERIREELRSADARDDAKLATAVKKMDEYRAAAASGDVGKKCIIS